MLTNQYKSINKEVLDFMVTLIPSKDKYLNTHFRRLARTVEVILDQKPTGKLLEIGTSGVIPIVLDKFAPDLEVVVTEFDLKQPKKGSTTVQVGKYKKTLECYRVNLESTKLPAKDESFDYVVCSEVIEHLERDPMFMLKEINRVLKTSKSLILTTPNVVSSRGITKMLLGIEPYFYMQYNRDLSLYRHNYEYSIHSLTKLLKAAGFDGSAWTEDTFEDPIMRDIQKLRSIGYPMNHIGDNIFTVSSKVSAPTGEYPDWIYAG
jgi:ubiquinone/menaquinone biosynthesis C-methylase UbiE